MMESAAEGELGARIRFGQIFAGRLEALGQDARDWLWFHPREDRLYPKDESVFDLLDLRKETERWESHFAPNIRPKAPDFEGDTLPFFQKRFLLFLIGGFGSHLLDPRILREAYEWNGESPWVFDIPYGNTLSSTEQCAQRAAQSCRDALERPEADGKQILFVGHSKGAIITLELLTNPDYADIRERAWGAISFAGAVGGSPAADSLLGEVVKASESAPAPVRRAIKSVGQAIAKRADHPLLAGLPSLADLPRGVRDLSRRTRHALLNRIEMPEGIQFFSIAGAIQRERVKPERFFSKDFDRTFLYLSTFELARYGPLNDTQLLLPDAKWPQGPNTCHLATINSDHWGLAYEKVLPGARADRTPRRAILESALCAIHELRL